MSTNDIQYEELFNKLHFFQNYQWQTVTNVKYSLQTESPDGATSSALADSPSVSVSGSLQLLAPNVRSSPDKRRRAEGGLGPKRWRTGQHY